MEVKGAFSGYSSDDIEACKRFYGEILGLDLKESMGGLDLDLPGGQRVFIYPKEDHEAAVFTVLNLVVEDIDAAVDDRTKKGVIFERYDNLPAEQDDRGVLRGKEAGMGPDIAWCLDPSGNIIAIVEEA